MALIGPHRRGLQNHPNQKGPQNTCVLRRRSPVVTLTPVVTTRLRQVVGAAVAKGARQHWAPVRPRPATGAGGGDPVGPRLGSKGVERRNGPRSKEAL